jgi:Succinate dehydrogenase/Fumarate reductase transmembrane subunit
VVPLPDHVGLVDPAPAHRHCAGRRLDPARLVARRRRGGRPTVRGDARLSRLADRGAAAVLLVGRIRHLAWDAGYGFEIRDAYRSGYAVLAATVVLTVLTWLYVLLA